MQPQYKTKDEKEYQEDIKAGVVMRNSDWKETEREAWHKEYSSGNMPESFERVSENAIADYWLSRMTLREAEEYERGYITGGGKNIVSCKIAVEKHISEIKGIIEGMKKDETCPQNNKPNHHYECGCSEVLSWNEALDTLLEKITSKYA